MNIKCSECGLCNGSHYMWCPQCPKGPSVPLISFGGRAALNCRINQPPPRETFSMQPAIIESEKETPLLRQRSNPPFYWINERPPTSAELDRWQTTAIEHLENIHRDPSGPDSRVTATEWIERLSGFSLSAVLEIKRLRSLVAQLTESLESATSLEMEKLRRDNGALRKQLDEQYDAKDRDPPSERDI